MKKIFLLVIASVLCITTNAQSNLKGDVNEDGVVDVSDITAVAQIILSPDHEYVDLGLPSGTLWAACNIGAKLPEEYGLYFAWAETTGYNSGKKDFSWSTYKYCNGTNTSFTKYCSIASSGTVDDKKVLDDEDDAAIANWGENWRMPTEAEWNELINSANTTTEWTTKNEVYGRLITSKTNSKSIFLPAAGCCMGTACNFAEQFGRYWVTSGCNSSARMLQLSIDHITLGSSFSRCRGLSIRPVHK